MTVNLSKRHQGCTKEKPAEHTASRLFYKRKRQASVKTKPTHTLTLDFSLQSCEERSSIIFATQSVVLSYGSPSKLIVHVSITAPIAFVLIVFLYSYQALKCL